MTIRDAADSVGLSPIADEDEQQQEEEEEESPQGTEEAADGVVNWQQGPKVHGQKGQKNKKKSEGVCE